MKILKASVPCDNGAVYSIDTIAHDGGLWLVPGWLEFTRQGWKKPRRMISLSALPHRVVKTECGQDYVILESSISKEVLDCAGAPSIAETTIILEEPDVRLPLNRKLNAL